jgi:hypothetical protein
MRLKLFIHCTLSLNGQFQVNIHRQLLQFPDLMLQIRDEYLFILFQVLVDFRVCPYMSLSIIRLLMRRLIYANEQRGYLGQYSSTIQRCAKKVEK